VNSFRYYNQLPLPGGIGGGAVSGVVGGLVA
jgi:hypothetical protein